MLKTYLNENIMKLSEEEKKYNKASYARVCKMYAGDMVLCNNLPQIDESVLYNCDELYNDEQCEFIEIYQYYLCNLSSIEKEALQDRGVIVSYSDMLDCDVICVDHWGTGWDYVLTDSELTKNLKECY